ncbi:MAG TPA: DUF5985 family protein [Polyangiaceae bacterium]
MALVVYALCAITSFACAVLLLRAHARSKVILLLWTSLCFFGLALNNVLLFADMLLGLDLAVLRKIPALAGVLLLLHGLVADSR